MNRDYASAPVFCWLRNKLGIKKPYALGLGEWDEWEADIKSTKPLAFWLTETLPLLLEKPAEWLVDPVSKFRYYLYNRYVSKTHYMRTNLTPGAYHSVDEKFLHGLFTELVDFVEIEKAHLQFICADKEEIKKYQVPFWNKYRWFKFRQWRCAQAGIDYLNWETQLVTEASWYSKPNDPRIGQPTSQAKSAKKILELYNWWTVIRPNRPDPWVASGLEAFDEFLREKYPEKKSMAIFLNLPLAEQKESRRLFRVNNRIEAQYLREDTKMMIELIKIRQSLWT